ncbi:MAG TPA: cell surface protein, partial [Pirellulales bacterium]|nr:cell surface protein [Pirellulales bacterium]
MSHDRSSRWMAVSVVGVLLASATVCQAAAAKAKFEVFPPDVNLATARDRQPVIAVVTRHDGVTLDVTKQAKFKLADAAIARLDGTTLYPLADGTTKLEVSYEGHRAEIPVVVKQAKA